MFECLTGRAPFVADNYNALIYEIQQSTPPPLGTLRPDVEGVFAAIVEKAMARAVEGRFQSAREMAELMSHWVGPHTNRSSDSSPLSWAATLPLPAPGAARRRKAKASR